MAKTNAFLNNLFKGFSFSTWLPFLQNIQFANKKYKFKKKAVLKMKNEKCKMILQLIMKNGCSYNSQK